MHVRYTLFTLFIVLFLILPACARQSDEPENETAVKLPENFEATVFADNLGRARHITVRSNGDVYVALRQRQPEGGIAALRDENNDGRADRIEYFGDFAGTGIGVHKGYLYFGSDTAVMRYRFKEHNLLPEQNPEFIAGGFPPEQQHGTKPFAFDEEGHVYVNVGAPSNACQKQMRTPGSPGMDPCPLLQRYGGIWRFDDSALNQKQMVHGFRYATGIRNAVAIDWNPNSQKLYVVQHGRDQLSQLWPDLYTVEENARLPAEEMFMVDEGDHFGWPYCYYDHLKGKKVLAPEYGGDGDKVGRCAEFEDPIIAFPAHWAPNDLLFYTGDQFPEPYRGGAFIAFHGSWNRAPLEQRGYNVVFVPFEGALPSGDYEIFADGFAGKEVIKSPREARFRPMGLAQGPDGVLYICDSVRGRIWRVTYTNGN